MQKMVEVSPDFIPTYSTLQKLSEVPLSFSPTHEEITQFPFSRAAVKDP